MRKLRLFSLLVLSLAAACDDLEPITVARCGGDAECGPDRVCEEGACVPKDAVSCGSVSGGKAILQPGPPMIEFGLVGPATSFRVIKLRNIGNCTLTVFEAYFESGDQTPFECPGCAASKFPLELFPFRDVELAVAFTPPEVGEYRDRLIFLSDDAEYGEIPVPVRARYSGVPDAHALPDRVDFGYVQVGRTVSKTIQLTNAGIGGAPLVVKGIEMSPSSTTAFSFDPPFAGDITLLPLRTHNDAIHTLNVRYHPREIGSHHAEIVVRTNQTTSGTLNIPITGTSKTPPKIKVTPELVNFGPVPLGRSTAFPVTITNEGGSPLIIDYRFGGGPSRTTDLSASPARLPPIEPGQYTELSVLATATSIGAITGLLLLETNDPSRPSITIPVSADGQDLAGTEVLKIDMSYENGDDTAFDDDLRAVDMTLENPFGLICNKTNANPTNWGSFGSPSWISFGVKEEPERIVLPNAEQDGTFRVLLSYTEDCKFVPSSLVAGVLGITVDVLLAYYLGLPTGVAGGALSDVIDDICFDHASTNATMTVYVNGQVIGEKSIRLGKKGDTIYALDIIRQNGEYRVR